MNDIAKVLMLEVIFLLLTLISKELVYTKLAQSLNMSVKQQTIGSLKNTEFKVIKV